MHVLDHNCYDPIEPLYSEAGFEPICVYCTSADYLRDSPSTDFYPVCDHLFFKQLGAHQEAAVTCVLFVWYSSCPPCV